MDEIEQEYRKLSGSKSEVAKYQDLAELLQDASVQTVIIATPSALHAELAKAAIAKGKHVILEKPMALSLRDADEIVKHAELHQVCVHMCHQLRYKPIMKRLKQLIDAGAMGTLYLALSP